MTTTASPAPVVSLPEGVDPALFTRQEWGSYTAEDHAVWGLLYERRMRGLEETGSRVFLDGAEAIGLRQDRVPDLDEVNAALVARTGWSAVPVVGFIPAREFFLCLAHRRGRLTPDAVHAIFIIIRKDEAS